MMNYMLFMLLPVQVISVVIKYSMLVKGQLCVKLKLPIHQNTGQDLFYSAFV